jgi:hypothetical protein
MNKIYFLTLLCVSFLLYNCKQTKDSGKISKAKVDSTIQHLNTLEDSIANSWQQMSKNEEDMFFNINRLLQEIEYIPGHDKNALDTLRKANERIKSMRYNQATMAESHLIDRYDEATSALINNVQRFAASVTGIEKHQVAVQLMEEIPQQYQKIYLNRVHYDFHIQDYNKLVDKHKKKLEKYDPKYKELRSRPMFQLSS